MQSTHMQAHTDSNKANNETSTDQHADRCMQTLTECTAAVRDRTATADHLELQRSTCDQLDARGRSRRMFGRSSFIGLIPRRWITIAATQWQFLATAWDAWQLTFFGTIRNLIPSKTTRKISPKYSVVDCVIKCAIKAKRSSFREYKRNPTPETGEETVLLPSPTVTG